MVRCLTFAVVVVILLAAVPGSAEDPLRLKLTPVTSGIRSDAPLALNVHLDWASTELLEGRLELSCYDGPKLLLRSLGSDVALFAGDRHSRTVLPPMALADDLTVLTVDARFRSEVVDFDLGRFEFRVPVHWRRSFVIGVMIPSLRAPPAGSNELGQLLRLEQLNQGNLHGNALLSTTTQITPDDVRASGLDFFPFDVLVLTHPAFRLLTPDQLDSIAGWVESGGSVLVVIDGDVSPQQARFLNRIAGRPEMIPELSADEVRLPAGGIPGQSGVLRMYRPGFGRAVIMEAEADRSTSLNEAAAFLWKVRSEIQTEFARNGKSPQLAERLSGPETDRFGNWQPAPYEEDELLYSPFQHVRLPESDSLATVLLPDAVQSLPLSVVVVILVLFLVAIVPLDYFLLGYFHNRRLTWIFLPAVSLLFTGVTSWLGSAYLGSTDYRTALEFIDLTHGDRVVRSSRFELLFTATQKESATELKQALTAGISPRSRMELELRDSGRGMLDSGDAGVPDDSLALQPSPESPLYDGNIPTLFTVRQQMRKWSPQLSRHTAVQTSRQVPALELDDVEATWRRDPAMVRYSDWQEPLRERIHAVLPDATIWLFTRHQVFDLTRGDAAANQETESATPGTKTARLQALVKAVCVRPPVGLFSLVSQISPNGAGNFEDLAIVDRNDPHQLLLVIVSRQGDDFVVFRRLFQRGP